jgi:hypothetical protein
MDALTIATGVTAANHAASLIKGIAQAIKASGKSEILGDVLDLQMAMIDVVLKQQQLIAENGELRSRVKELEETLKVQGEIERHGNALFLKSDEKRQHPYCLACWGFDHKLVGMSIKPSRSGKLLHCKICAGRRPQ